MPADRPYQSNLLSFLNRQAQVAKDRTGIFWRKLKLSATTAFKIGIQGILYPFYAVLKAAQLVGKQIGQQGKAEFWLRSGLENPDNSSEAPSSDSPLTNLLTALTQRQLASTSVGDADELTMVLAAEMAIQGVASRISDHRLVLVTPTQQVLDVLSDRQALAIQKRISYEVAMYLRWVRSHTLKGDRNPTRKSIKSFNPPALQPQALQPQSEIQVSSVRIPTLWQDQPNLGFFSLPNLQDLPSLQELPNLLQAAFKYFFGRSSVLGLGESVPHQARYQPSLGRAESIALSAAPSKTQYLTATSKEIISTRISSPVSSRISTRAKTQKSSSEIIENFDCNPGHAPDWLETEAEHLGYDRNWLDHCIGLLDEILVRIEKTFLTIWRFLSSLFQTR
jgi:hypothetical protein